MMMKRIALIALAAMLGGCASKNEGSSHGHHQEAGDARPGHHMSMAGGKLMVQTDPAAVKAGQPTTLRLMIHDADGAMISHKWMRSLTLRSRAPVAPEIADGVVLDVAQGPADAE